MRGVGRVTTRDRLPLAILLALGLSTPATAKLSGMVCPKNDDTVAASSDEPANQTQLFGCLDRQYDLVPISIPGARRAIIIAGDPGSSAAMFRYTSRSQRNRQVLRWWRRIDPLATPYRPIHANFGTWTYQFRTMPTGIVSFAMHRAYVRTGIVCVTRTDGLITKQAIAVLNNWCLDASAFWRRR